MKTYSIFIILLAFIPALINVAIFIYTFYFLRRDKLVVIFSMVLFTSAIWQLSDSLLRYIDNITTAAIIYRELSFGVIFLLPTILHFALLFTNNFNKKKTSIILSVLYLPAFLFYIANTLRLEKGGLVMTKLWHFSYVPLGILDAALNLWLGILGVITLYIFIKYAIKAKKIDTYKYKSTLLITASYSIPAIMGIITQLLFPYVFKIAEWPLTTTFISIFSVTAFYCLIKYNLFTYNPYSISNQIFNSISESIIITDLNNNVRYINKTFTTTFGYSEENILNTNYKKIIIDNTNNLFNFSLEDKYLLPTKMEYNILHKDKSIKNVLLNQSPFYDHNGKKSGFLNLISDITMLKESENEFIKTEQKLLLSQKSAGIGFIFLDLSTNLITINTVAKKIFNLTNNQKYTCNEFVDAIVHPNDRNMFKEILKHVQEYKTSESFEHRVINKKNKTIKWVKTCVEIFYKDEVPSELISTIIDITDSKNHEKEELIAMLQGEEKEKKRIAQELHDGIAQYIAAINMNLNGIKDEIPRNLTKIYNIIKKLTEKSLNETRNMSHDLIPKEINNGLVIAIRHIIESYHDNTLVKINLEVKNLKEEVIPQFTKFNLYRITQEFINNTFKYANAKNINIVLNYSNNTLYYTLLDDGSGFKIDDKKINGIGLTNMQQRVKAIDGTLKFTSTIGIGTKLAILINLE